ncbi:MAG: thioesterase domain-containing protein [Terriglobia bacterium]
MTSSTTLHIDVREDETTRKLVRLWQDLLGVGSIGLNENYFELGGDSILAVHLFAEIEKVFKVKLPVASLYETPTIEELAQVLRGEAAVAGWSSLVAIQPAGSRLPFFCMHGAGGNVLIYRDLARHLGPDQPFYGLQSQGLDGSCPPLTTVEEMAAVYVKEIRSVQPHGPYFLGGYCGGGTIAFEVAQQLRVEGEEADLLALFDTMNWSKARPFSLWARNYYLAQRLAFHVANFFRLDSEGKSKFLLGKIQVLRSRVPVWRDMLLARLDRRSRTEGPPSRLLARIWEANDRACSNYIPKPYPGSVTDFRPIKQYRIFNQPNLKWDRLALEGQEVITLPVYPAGMLVEPFVRHLAAALRMSIDTAIRRHKRVDDEPQVSGSING